MLSPLHLLLLPYLASAIVLDPSWKNVHYPKPPAPRDINNPHQPREPEPEPEPEPYIKFPLHNPSSEDQYHPELEVRQAWLRAQSRNLRRKYKHLLSPRETENLWKDEVEEEEFQRKRRSLAGMEKRANATVSLIDVGIDASYGTQVSIGTPAQNFYLVLDTGSADLWVAGAECDSSSCVGTTRFQESSSSTYKATGSAFDITYGSGEAEGNIATDTVSLGGITVTAQTIAVVNQTSANLISSPLSGIMGLAWKPVAQTKATPWWQTLMSSGQISNTIMGFYMARWRGVKGVSQTESNGGEFTFGGADTGKYTGNINYISMTGSTQDYWRIPAQALNIQNQSVTISSPQVAIDTGTTLIGVPSATAAAIYAKISGATQLTGSYAGYYQYPCSTTIKSSIQFGGLVYSISNADFNIGPFTRDTTQCTGAFFALDLDSSSTISWIAGATFLKNVYSIFRYNPPSIGFAALASGASSVSNGTTASTTTTNSGSTTSSSSAGNLNVGKIGWVVVVLGLSSVLGMVL